LGKLYNIITVLYVHIYVHFIFEVGYKTKD